MLFVAPFLMVSLKDVQKEREISNLEFSIIRYSLNHPGLYYIYADWLLHLLFYRALYGRRFIAATTEDTNTMEM